MTGRTKSDALIRDIAELFVRYSMKDWAPVVEQLRQGGDEQFKIAEAIAKLQMSTKPPAGRSRRAVTPRKKPKVSKPKSSRNQPELLLASTFSAARAPVLEALEHALRGRQVLNSAGQLREIYLQSGGKGDLPKSRSEAAATLLSHLDQVPEKEYQAALEALRYVEFEPDSLSESYARWFNLIQSGAKKGSNNSSS